MNEKEEIDKLIAFLGQLEAVHCYVELIISLGTLGHQRYQQVLDVVLQNPKATLLGLTLSATRLDKLEAVDQGKLIHSVLKSKRVSNVNFSNNTLWELDAQSLNNFLDSMVSLAFKGQVYLWANFNDIIAQPLAAKWDEERKKQFLRAYLKSQTLAATVIKAEEPFKCALSDKEYLEIFSEYLEYGKEFQKFFTWMGQATLSEDTRFELAKKWMLMIHGSDKECIKKFNLTPERRLQLYLDLNKIDHDLPDSDDFYFEETSLKVAPFLSLFKLPEENDFTMDDWFQFIREQTGVFFTTCQTFWPNSSFYMPARDKVLNCELNYGNFTKMTDKMSWITDAVILLGLEPVETVIARDAILKLLIQEILEFPDKNICYKLWNSIMNPIWTAPLGQGFKTLEALREGQRGWTLLLTIPLCHIVLEAQEKEAKEYFERAKAILHTVPVTYKHGHYFRTLVSAFQMLANVKNMPPNQKLTLMETVLGIKKDKPNLKTLKPTAAELKAQRELAKKHKTDQKNVKLAKEKLKEQVSLWLLFQGLAGVSELGNVETSSIEKLFESLKMVVSKLFELEKEEAERYQTTFGGLRNEGALLTYLSKINLLVKEQRADIADAFQGFVRSVLTLHSQGFYETRYAEENSAHLSRVFKDRTTLKTLWQTGEEPRELVEFIKTNGLVAKPFTINYQTFFTSRIVKHNHLDPIACDNLKAYLKAKEVSEKQKIKTALKASMEDLKAKLDKEAEEAKAKEADKDKKEASEKVNLVSTSAPAADSNNNQQKTFQLMSLEMHFMDLIETEAQDKASQIKYLMGIVKLVNKINPKIELANDLNMLHKRLTLKETTLKGDLKGWKIENADHFWDLFMSGTDVPGSCQRVDGEAKYNKCLLGYVLDGKNRMLAIKDASGTIQARAIVRILWDAVTEDPVLQLEEIYPFTAPSLLQQALETFAKEMAARLNLSLIVDSSEEEEAVRYPNEVSSLAGPAPWEYVDALHTQVERGEFSLKAGSLVAFQFPMVRSLSCADVESLFPNKWKGTQMIKIIADYTQLTKEDKDALIPFKFANR